MIIAIDIETTGLDSMTHDIWEVGIARLGDEGTISAVSWLVRPPDNAAWSEAAREFAQGVDLGNAPTIHELWPTLDEHLSRASLICAHGRAFERSFLDYRLEGLWQARGWANPWPDRREIVRLPDWMHPKRWVCTLELAQALLHPPHRLADVCAALGVAPPSPAHRAAPDAVACLEVLRELRRRVRVTP